MTKLIFCKHLVMNIFAIRTLWSRCLIVVLNWIAGCFQTLSVFNQLLVEQWIASIYQRSANLQEALNPLAATLRRLTSDTQGTWVPEQIGVLLGLGAKWSGIATRIALMRCELVTLKVEHRFANGVSEARCDLLAQANREQESLVALRRSLREILNQKNEQMALYEVIFWMIVRAKDTHFALGDFRECGHAILTAKGEKEAFAFARRQIRLNAWERFKSTATLFGKISGKIGALRYVLHLWRRIHGHHGD